MRTLAGAGVAVLAAGSLIWTFGAAHAEQGTPRAGERIPCSVEKLPLPNDAVERVEVDGADPSGKHIIASNDQVADHAGWIWTDGANPEAIPNDNDFSWVTAVNGAGVVVGHGSTSLDYDRSWKYEDGESSDLIGLPSDPGSAEARDINAGGDIVGGTNNRWSDQPQVVWPGGDAENAQKLPDSAGINAWAISDEGVIVGGNSESAYVWPDSTSAPEKLNLPNGVRPGTEDRYWISGDWAVNAAGARWNLADGTTEALEHRADSVNSAGDAGSAQAGGIIRTEGTVEPLPALEGYELGNVIVLDPDAEHVAVGSVVQGEGDALPVRWSC